jgi:TonB-dependent receptor
MLHARKPSRFGVGRGGLFCAAASAVLLGAFSAGSAYAQDNATDVDEVVVTGVRASMRSAQTIKKNSDLVVDSIVADDIGKLPDNNVADALARAPGVQVRRDSGEANSVLIRGLPNLVTLLNGREVFTTTGRYMALADIPSSMLQRVDVYKTAEPAQIEGGIAGAIDVRTRRPFDFPGLSVNAFARGVHSDKADAINPDMGVTASNRWDTRLGEIGALIGLSYVNREFHEERAFNVASDPQGGQFNPAHPAPVADFRGPFVMGYIPISGERERKAANFALQWRPDDTSEVYAEGFITDYANVFSLDFFVGLPFLGNGDISATVFPGTNQMKTLTNHNVFTITSTQANDQHSQTKQASIGGFKEWGDIKVSADLSYTDSYYDYRNPIMDTSTTVPLVQVDTSAGGTAQLNYIGDPNFDITDGANFNIENWFDNYGRQEGDSIDFRADVAWTSPVESWVREMRAGFRYADRFAESNQSYGGAAYPFSPHRPTSALAGLDGLSERMASGGPDYIMYQWYTPSRDYLLNNTDLVRQNTALLYVPYSLNTATGVGSGTTAAEFNLRNDPATGMRRLDPGMYFSDTEKTTAWYFQTKIGGDIGSIPYTGVIGLRVVKTSQELGGNIAQSTRLATPYNTINLNAPENFLLNYTPTVSNNSSLDVLPSANFKFNIRPDLIARLSAGRTVTRPDFAQLNPGVSLSTIVSNTTFLSGSGGNPKLQQVTSDAVDASLEWYFAQDGFVTASAFYRSIEGYVETTAGSEVISGRTYVMTRPSNSGSSNLRGLELAYQQFYDWLPGVFSGFGLSANATFMDGEMTNATLGTTSDFRGLSKFSYNVALLYEKGPWSGRLAYNWRKNFLDTPNFENRGVDLIVADTAQADGSVSYKLNDKLTLTLEGINLLDTEFKDYFDDAYLYPRDTRRYDRQILVGFRWSL